jgi:hypothetical protein
MPKAIVVANIGGHKVAAIPFEEESGVYGYIGVLMIQKTSRGYRIVTEPRDFDFSDFGGWRFEGSKVLKWDMVYKADVESHGEAHQFQLDEFSIRDGKLVKLKTRRTKRKYLPFGNRGLVMPVLARNDPLREFGLRWTCWW